MISLPSDRVLPPSVNPDIEPAVPTLEQGDQNPLILGQKPPEGSPLYVLPGVLVMEPGTEVRQMLQSRLFLLDLKDVSRRHDVPHFLALFQLNVHRGTQSLPRDKSAHTDPPF